jgi:hypothetical protein
MINPTGFLTANGITGQDLLRILEIKIHHPNSLPSTRRGCSPASLICQLRKFMCTTTSSLGGPTKADS